nr:PKD domain-containing protein [Ornithinimicrobium cavernae]
MDDPTSATPSFTPALVGTYTATLVVSDGTQESAADTVAITVGDGITVDWQCEGVTVTAPVRMSRIIVAQGEEHTRHIPRGGTTWTLRDTPGITTIWVSARGNNSGDGPGYGARFDRPVPDPCPPANEAPVADAGPDQTAITGDTVTLDGTGSTDPDGDDLSYAWTLTSPSGSTSVLDGSETAQPSFAPDLAGAYTAELVVNDGTEPSAPDTVTITVSEPPNQVPVADAGPDQSAITGGTVTLDGTNSTDPDGDTLTYAWTLAAPDGSTAALDDTSASRPSLIPDLPGEYAATLVVNDGTTDSPVDSVVILVTEAPGIDLPDEIVGKDLQVTSHVQLTEAPAAPTDVTVTVADESVAIISSDPDAVGAKSVTFEGVDDLQVQRFTVQGLAEGTTTMTVSAPGYADTTATITVTGSGFDLTLGDFVTSSNSGDATVYVELRMLDAAGAIGDPQWLRAGTNITVNLTNSNDAVGTLTESAVTFHGGNGAEWRRITYFDPHTVGQSTITLLQPEGFTTPTDGKSPVTAYVVDPEIVLDDVNVPTGEVAPATVSFAAAPPDPTTLSASVADESTALLSTSPDGPWSPSISFADVTDTSEQTFYVQGLAQGETTLRAGAYDTNSAVANVTVGAPNSAPVADGGEDLETFTDQSPILDGTGSSDPDGDSLTYAWTVVEPEGSDAWLSGANTAQPLFHSLWSGIYTVDLTVTDQWGASSSDSVTISVHPKLWVNDITVGKDLQAGGSVVFYDEPLEPVDVTITVGDESIALVSPDGDTVGSKSLTVEDVGDFFFVLMDVQVQGLVAGTTTLTVTATGYPEMTSTITVVPDVGFAFWTPDFSIEESAEPHDVSVYLHPLNADGNKLHRQDRRAGAPPVTVHLANSNDAVGTLLDSQLVFLASSARANTSFTPASAGTTEISLTQPDGFTQPTDGASSITATVTPPPQIHLGGATVGKDLQTYPGVRLSLVPPEPIDITLTVEDESIAVLASGAREGSKTLTLHDARGSEQSYTVQGLTKGTTTVTASAPGFPDATSTVTVTGAGFDIQLGSFTTAANSPDVTMYVVPYALTSSGTRLSNQAVRHGTSFTIPLSNSNDSVGIPTEDELTFGGGTWRVITYFDPQAVGTSTLSITQPDGFTTPTDGRSSVTATVVEPQIVLGDVTVVTDQVSVATVAFAEAPPEPATIGFSVAGAPFPDPEIALVSTNPDGPWSLHGAFEGVTDTSEHTFYVKGVTPGTTALQAGSHNLVYPGVATVTVLPAGPQAVLLPKRGDQVDLVSAPPLRHLHGTRWNHSYV